MLNWEYVLKKGPPNVSSASRTDVTKLYCEVGNKFFQTMARHLARRDQFIKFHVKKRFYIKVQTAKRERSRIRTYLSWIVYSNVYS